MKTILTTDKAYVPYGYPRLNDQRGIDELYINSLSGDTINLFASVPLKLENIQTQTHSQILSINNVGEVYKMDVSSIVSEQITGGTFSGNTLLLTTNSGKTITIPEFNTFYNSNGELNFDRTVSLLDNSLTFSSIYNNNSLIIKNGNVGIGHSNPQTLLHVSNGQTGSMAKDLYESAVIENVNDTKFGIYTSANIFPIGGVSVLLGHSHLVNDDGYYPGFEIQYYTPNGAPSSSLIRFNYTQRESTGVVQYFVADLFKVESTGTVTLNPNNVGTSITTKPKLGIGTSTPRPNSIVDLESNESGLLLPRLSTTERNGVVWTPFDAGMLIYNNTTNSLNYRNQNSWVDLTGIDNNIYITGGTFNGSTLSLNSNSGTTVNITGFTTPPPGWSLTGVTGTNPSINFVGTIDDQDLVFRTNNIERVRITNTGYTTTNNNGFGTDFIQLNTTPTNVGTKVGKFIWNDTDGTVDLGLKGGSVTLQLGQEQVLRVVNKSGVDLLESNYQVVKIIGATGQRVSVDLAQANNTLNSETTIGIVTETIIKNKEGFITVLGQVREIDTTGSLQGETWNDGDVLYLSTTVPGQLTNIKPTSPSQIVRVGYVEYSHTNHGKIFVKIDVTSNLGDLNDVYAPTPIDKQTLYWNSGTTRYELITLTNLLGYTPIPNTRSITINGDTKTLDNDRSWTINDTFITGGTFNGSTLSLNSNSGTTVNVTGFTTPTVIPAWNLTGNTGTNPASNFIGTTDNQPFVIRVNNNPAARFNSPGGFNWFFHGSGGAEGGFGEFGINVGTDIYFRNTSSGVGLKTGTGSAGSARLVLQGNGDLIGLVQRFGIGTATPAASSILDLTSTTRGFLPPRQTTTERNAIATPATGLQIYNTTTNSIDINRGTPASPSWQQLLHTAGGQTVNGTLTFGASAASQPIILTAPNGTTTFDFGIGNGDTLIRNRVSNSRLRIYSADSSTLGAHIELGGSNYSSGLNGYITINGGNSTFNGAAGQTRITAASSNISSTTNRDGGDVIINGGARASGGGIDGNVSLANDRGNVIIGSTSGSSSAKLQIDSTTQGLLPPRMTLVNKNSIVSPATGLEVFDIDANRPSYRDSTGWKNVANTDDVASLQTASQIFLSMNFI